MARATIIIGDGGGAYTFSVSPAFLPQIETLRDRDGTRIGERETWPVRGYLSAADTDAVVAAFDSLKAKLETEQVNIYWKKDGVTKRSLTTAATERGPKFNQVKVISKPGNWSTHLFYNFDIIAERYDALTISHDYDISYRTNEENRDEQVKTGMVRTKLGTSAKTVAENAQPSSAGYKLVSQSIQVDDDDVRAQYSYVLREYFKALPAGIRWGQRDISETINGYMKTITGSVWFQAETDCETAKEAALTWLDEKKSEYEADPISYSLGFSEDTRRATLNFTFEVPNEDYDANLIEFEREISLSGGLDTLAPYEIPGKNPLIFKGAREALFLADSGVVKYRGGQPPFPPILSIPDFDRKSRSISFSRQRNQAPDAEPVYIMRWSHSYVSGNPDAADNLDLEQYLAGDDYEGTTP